MTMPLQRLVLIIRARWASVVLTWIAIVSAVLAISLALPARYEASATVVVDMNAADPITGRELFKPDGTISTYIATQVDIMRSEAVALGALRSLGLQERQEWRNEWQARTDGRGDFESWLASRLLRKLDVRALAGSNVLAVRYTSQDPQFSAAVVNAFVRSYIDTTLQMRSQPAQRFNSFFAERAKSLREALEQARSRLSAYEKQHGVLVGQDPDIESARLAQLTTQLVALEDAAAQAANARKQAGDAPADMREVRSDPEVAALTAEVVRQEGRLADLRADFGEQHHAVIQARQSLADLKRRLEAATRRAAHTFEPSVRISEARLAEVRAAVERQRAIVQQRKSQRDAAAALLRDVENAQKAYDAVLERASHTALEGANKTQPHVSIAKSATPPSEPWPLLRLNLSVALVLGLLLGIAQALYAENRDRRLRSVEDVTGWLQQPLLLALPDGCAPNATRRSIETRQRLVRLSAPPTR
jgi:succinoglycan biosynthesis transport protein ExoP